jgi:hypothetical protein
MGIVQKILGPKSKYDHSLPYTYEAREPIMEGDDTCNSYLSDTICGLIEYLAEHNMAPNTIELFEIYQEEEHPIDISLCINAEQRWLSKPELCFLFKEHYKGHIQDGKCSFRDRDRSCTGPE